MPATGLRGRFVPGRAHGALLQGTSQLVAGAGHARDRIAMAFDSRSRPWGAPTGASQLFVGAGHARDRVATVFALARQDAIGKFHP
jgi:hypothetical protein